MLAHDDGRVWLRIWVQALVLAFLTGRPLPHVPAPLRPGWGALSPRRRECVLATVIDGAVTARATALRQSYDPRFLMSVVRVVTARMLDAADLPARPWSPLPFRAGHVWVIPQLRWLHELERVCPLDAPAPDPFALAPPLDYSLPGLADRPDVKMGQRVSGLRRHQLSMEVTRNRLIAWTALLGEDDQAGFIEDLAAVAIGVSHRGQLGKAAGEMGVTGWLEAVLSWPRRFIVGADDLSTSLAAREPDPVAG